MAVGAKTAPAPAAGGKKKPVLFFTALPAEGHANPLIKVAQGLVERGYEVVFHCNQEFEPRIRAIGAAFADAPPLFPNPELFAEMLRIPLDRSMERLAFGISKIFLASIPARTDSVGAALAALRARLDAEQAAAGPGAERRQILVMSELCAMGVAPFKKGRAPPKGFEEDGFPTVIGLSAIMLAVHSRDTAPYMLGLPFDNTESGRLRNDMLNRLLYGPGGMVHYLVEECHAKLVEAGANLDQVLPELSSFGNFWYLGPEVCLQMCLPAQEYPLSDLSDRIHFVGCLPRRAPQPHDTYPEWWGEILANAQLPRERRKKVIFVSQGTVAMDHSQLVLPTFAAFADRADDVLVVAALGARGAALPPDAAAALPPNARVADYLPYDTMLHEGQADIFVSNAGYGALCHAVVNAVPLVLAGVTEDKTEATLRATRAGYAVGLYTQTPTAEQVRAGVETVLADGRYKARAEELMRENEKMGCLDRIEGFVRKYTV
ncbi:hypothetical protein SLS62_008109 [Diatrype stigma]|uniref:Erythromycin biosynthesis protein CIII-like C-terminal domain-containing protein n=1 Tax=Diatrype stigma TaxID=117547 RepID=A0AAN9UL50_9PEZI